ncbi:FecR family protein [Flagellimonas nanhaiensis]|uniref:DUF4974 domain-containing protein n=1 Tax=Flagellimonas nanhaiensis TaxID=2292706 RepID=A0A371JN44_9FLAO|nr:FecR domain-containing protein [Allomuricauda nanhaiensis]RDY58628.1 DUF4974 domain-containing protein [Allomuricauda nanhaiensis]
MDRESLIKKWLGDTLTEEEAKTFRTLDDAPLYKEIVEEARRFHGTSQVRVPTFEELEKNLYTSRKVPRNWIRIVSGIAAAFIISIGLYTLIDKFGTTTYRTDFAQIKGIMLPDDSSVRLNTLSQISYNGNRWDEERKLTLNGEAYFDVARGRRFDVSTLNGTVSVLGTEFNVLSRDSIFVVSCFEGLVGVNYGNKTVQLPAGSKLTLSAGGDATTSKIYVSEPYWLKGLSVFKNAPIVDVISELEMQYRIKVDYQSEKKLHFTGAFEHTHLENALRSITQPLNLIYVITDKNVVTIRDARNQ